MSAVGYTSATGDTRKVSIAGDTMTGPLVLSGAPAVPLGAASKDYADTDAPAHLRRPADHGLAAWTFPPSVIQSGGNANYAATGVLYVGRLRLARATTLARGYLIVTTIPSGLPSNAYLGLYDAAGTLRAASADQGAAWNTAGQKVPAFTAPYAAAAGEYYVGVLIGALAAGTTMPALCQSTIGGGFVIGVTNFNLAAPSLLYGTTGGGLTALPASITPAALTASERAIFLGVGV
jgi:hypothetical protein